MLFCLRKSFTFMGFDLSGAAEGKKNDDAFHSGRLMNCQSAPISSVGSSTYAVVQVSVPLAQQKKKKQYPSKVGNIQNSLVVLL